MKRFKFFIALTICAFVISSCKDEMLSGGNPRKAPSLAAEYNADFDSVAFAVNQLLLKNVESRHIIHAEVGKKFDGNYNVLISQLIEKHPSFVEWLNELKVDVYGIVKKYPFIQIAIPVNYEKWDGEEMLPVVYFPYGYQINSEENLWGYDTKGEKKEFTKNEFLKEIFVVVCENERLKGEEFAKEYDADFNSVAFAVNRLLQESQDFRNLVHKEVGGMFDGDYNVLISQLVKNYPAVAKWFNDFKVDIYGIVEKYPLIQIAIPVEYEEWDGQEGLPVVYIQYEFRDGETPYVYGYDKAGKFCEVDAIEGPNFPVAVISMNERTRLLAKAPEEPDELTPSAPRELAAQSTAIGIKLTWLKPTSGTITGYAIFRKGVGEANYSLIQSIYGEDNLHYEDIDIKPQLNYSYYAKAFYEEEDDYPDYIVQGNPFVLGHIFHVPGQRHYSPPSNYVTGNSPALAMPGGIKLVHGNAGELDLEWDSQTAYANEYEIWRKSTTNTTLTLQGTTPGNFNFFTQSGLSAGVYYNYRVRAKTLNGNYSAWSNSIGTSVSERNLETPFKLTYLKFKDEAALKKVEPWVKGAPELWLIAAKGDAANAQKVKEIRYKPSSRKACYESWAYANKIILNNWNPNRDGNVFTFEWIEEDCYWGTYTLKITTSYEEKLSDTQTFKAGAELSITVGKEDDKMGSSLVTWWNPKSTKFNVSAFGSEFYWYIE